MTISRPKAPVAKAEAAAPKKPPVIGGSTTVMLSTLTVGELTPADRKKISKDNPFVASIAVANQGFANVRNKSIEHLGNELNKMVDSLQNTQGSLSIMTNTKEAKQLEMTVNSLSSKVSDILNTHKTFLTSLDEKKPVNLKTFVDLLLDIIKGGGKINPSRIDPALERIAREVKTDTSKKDNIELNSKYLLDVDLRRTEQQAEQRATAYKSSKILSEGSFTAPQLGGTHNE